MILKWLSIILLFPVLSQALENKESIDAWVFAMSSPEVSDNKVKPFFNHLTKITGYSFQVTNSTNIAGLKSGCHTGKPSIVVVGSATGDFLKKHCHYKTLATSALEVLLYRRNDSDPMLFEDIQLIGFIKDSKLADVALNALSKSGKKFKGIYYPNFFDMVQKSKRDKLDAVILSPGVAEGAAYFAKSWTPIFSFKEKSRVNVVASPLLTKELETKITSILLSNSDIVKNVWQNEIGLGPFIKAIP